VKAPTIRLTITTFDDIECIAFYLGSDRKIAPSTSKIKTADAPMMQTSILIFASPKVRQGTANFLVCRSHVK
jgi:hypothetical protein